MEKKKKKPKKEKEPKFDPSSQLYILQKPNVSSHPQLPFTPPNVWKYAEDEINLGSIEKPNRDIIGFKYIVPFKWF